MEFASSLRFRHHFCANRFAMLLEVITKTPITTAASVKLLPAWIREIDGVSEIALRAWLKGADPRQISIIRLRLVRDALCQRRLGDVAVCVLFGKADLFGQVILSRVQLGIVVLRRRRHRPCCHLFLPLVGSSVFGAGASITLRAS